jgi:transcriptional regulator with PAS, ATPase and Fis domain
MNGTPPNNIIEILNQFIKNDLPDEAEKLIKRFSLKIEIKNGILYDLSNTTEAWLRRFITVNPSMMIMKDKVRKLSKIDDEVLIQGETGTGKEIIARALHGDREGRFIAVNCAGIPEHLLESSLFGYIKGAFTGAFKDTEGLMSKAKGGTLFLDEIGEMPLELQAKLLRAIQEKIITRVGGDIEEKISCRITAATNRNLVELCGAKLFRVDLLARISTFEIELYPIKKRQEDIEPIFKSLPDGEDYINALHLHQASIPNKLAHFTVNYPYNVRSIQSAVRRWKILGEL